MRPQTLSALLAGQRRAFQERKNQQLADADRMWASLSNNPLFMLGVGLYWGEGSKSEPRLELTNADPTMIRTWLRWCRAFMPGVPLRFSLYIHTDVVLEDALAFWRSQTGADRLVVVTASPRSSKGTKVGRLPMGTMRVTVGVGGREWYRKMMRWIELCGAFG